MSSKSNCLERSTDKPLEDRFLKREDKGTHFQNAYTQRFKCDTHGLKRKLRRKRTSYVKHSQHLGWAWTWWLSDIKTPTTTSSSCRLQPAASVGPGSRGDGSNSGGPAACMGNLDWVLSFRLQTSPVPATAGVQEMNQQTLSLPFLLMFAGEV